MNNVKLKIKYIFILFINIFMSTKKIEFNATRRKNTDRYRFFHNLNMILDESNFKRITTPISYFNVVSKSILKKRVGISSSEMSERKRLNLYNKLKYIYGLPDEIKKEYNEYQKDHYIGSLNYEYDQSTQHVNNFERSWWNGRNNIRHLNLKSNILVNDKKILNEKLTGTDNITNLGDPMEANNGMSLDELRSNKLAHDCYNVFYKFPKPKGAINSKNNYMYYYTNYVSEYKSIYYLTELDFMGVLRQLDFNYERQYDNDIDHVIYKSPYKSYNDFGLLGKEEWSNENVKLDVLDNFQTGESKSCPLPIYDGLLGHPFYLKREMGINESKLSKLSGEGNNYKKYPVVFHEGESGNIYLYYKGLKDPKIKFDKLKKYLFDINTHLNGNIIDTYINRKQYYSKQTGGQLPYVKFGSDINNYDKSFDDNFQFISIPSPPHGLNDPRMIFEEDKKFLTNIDIDKVNKTNNSYIDGFYNNYKYSIFPYARENTGYYGLNYIGIDDNRGVYQGTKDVNPVKYLNRNGRNNRFCVNMNVNQSYANYIKNMRESMLLFIAKYGTNKGGSNFSSVKDSITKQNVIDFINYRRNKNYDVIDLGDIEKEVDYYCNHILNRMRELVYPSFLEDRNTENKYNKVDLLADVSSPLMWYHNRSGYIYSELEGDVEKGISIKYSNLLDKKLLNEKTQDIFLNYYLGVCKDMLRFDFGTTDNMKGNDEDSMYKRMVAGRKIYYGLNLANDVVGRVLFDYPNHPSSGFRHFNLDFHDSLDIDYDLLKKYLKSEEDITNFESKESYNNIPIFKRYIDKYFRDNTENSNGENYDLFDNSINKGSNINLSNFLGKQYRLLNVSTSDILASRKNINDNDVTNVTRISSTGPYGKRITTTNKVNNRKNPLPVLFDDHAKFYSNYSIDGAPNFGIIIKIDQSIIDNNSNLESEDQYDIPNLLDINIAIYFDNISKRVFIFCPIGVTNEKLFYTFILKDILVDKYGFRLVDKSCFSCGKLKPEFSDDHNSYGKKYHDLNFDKIEIDTTESKIYMRYFSDNNKTKVGSKFFSENYLYEIVINQNSYLAKSFDNQNYIRLLNKISEEEFRYSFNETYYPIKNSILNKNILEKKDYFVRLMDLSGLYCLLFLVVMSYNINVPTIQEREPDEGIDMQKQKVVVKPILSFDDPFKEALNYILPLWDESSDKIMGRMKKIPFKIFEELISDEENSFWNERKLNSIYNKMVENMDYKYIKNYFQDVQKVADLIGSSFFENWTIHHEDEYRKYKKLFADEIYDVNEIINASKEPGVETI